MPSTTSTNPDLIALRNWVTASDYKPESSSQVIKLDLTHSNLSQQHLEIRFDIGSTVGDLRRRFYQTTGTPPGDQRLQVFAGDDLLHDVTDGDDRPLLGSLPHYYRSVRLRIHCIDTNPCSVSARGALENTNLVEKFVLDDEAYAQRKNTLRAWAQQQKEADPNFNLQRYGIEHQALQQARLLYKRRLPLPDGFMVLDGQFVKEEKESVDLEDEYPESSIAHAEVGNRCQVDPGQRRGTVRWTGRLPGKPGYWIGVELDEPVGSNDGSIDGDRFFECAAKYGCFVRGPKVDVGDFPERDLWDESDSDEEL